MNFYVVFTNNKNKFDKYVKVNKIKNKVIIDIKSLLVEYDIENYYEHKDYFNLLVYTKILHSLEKKKDIYYIPNFLNKNFNIDEIIKIKDLFNDINFNLLLFFDEFKNNNEISDKILNNMDLFDTSQILKSY